VSFIDAAGLGALVAAASQAAAHGTTVRVVCSRPRIRRLFRLTDLDRSLRLARTLAEARQGLAAEETAARNTPAGTSEAPADLRFHLPAL
jgi:anti-anti-sigma regulatory factor